MVTMDEAKQIVLAVMEKGTVITAELLYQGDYLFFAIRPDAMEGHYDPFVKVNVETGEFNDWSPHDYENSAEVLAPMGTQADGVREDVQ